MPQTEITNMALFCDFENIALGVRDAKYDKFDIGKVLERLLLKGSIVVKKAYCDWERYKAFKAPMHERRSRPDRDFPHVSRQYGQELRRTIRMGRSTRARPYLATPRRIDETVQSIISGRSGFLAARLLQAARETTSPVIRRPASRTRRSGPLLIACCRRSIIF
jgi:hypothetical protein